METLTVNFKKDSVGKINKIKIISYLERKGIPFKFKSEKEKPIPKKICDKCGSLLYENPDCDECIRNVVGEVYYGE
jgi:uncharacterized OB-fold protein